MKTNKPRRHALEMSASAAKLPFTLCLYLRASYSVSVSWFTLHP